MDVVKLIMSTAIGDDHSAEFVAYDECDLLIGDENVASVHSSLPTEELSNNHIDGQTYRFKSI